ncbi:condensin subunit cnd3 [Moniliophthora roreri]|nr:condensin subunit cnd3 [Moniliophthora roreri]
MALRSNITLEEIAVSISGKFEEAQSTTANHRKNCVALHKVHSQASRIIHTSKQGKQMELAGEAAFQDAFIDMINRILDVKKGPCADRVVRFVGSYVKFVNEKAQEEKSKQDEGTSASAAMQSRDDEDTYAFRFVSRVLKHLFQGFKAKNKVVRQRSVQVVSEMMTNIGEIDEETYNLIRENLIQRLNDKEGLIRAHSVVALSKLIGTEDSDELEDGESTVEELLLDALCYDSAPEVRRAALLNIPLTPQTLPVIMTRMRDTDSITRKLVFSAVLKAKLEHPRRLTIAQREEIVKAGLGDREAAVRAAAGKLVTGWFELVSSEPDNQATSTWTGDDGGVMKGLVKFLQLFDVVGPGAAVAVDAVLAIFTMKPNLSNVFVFPEEIWKELTPELAILARIFVEHCIESAPEERLEAASMPVLTAMAFYIQEAYNTFLSTLHEAELLDAEDDAEAEVREEELASKEMILGELLRVSMKLDFMDEIGRRKLFSVVKDTLAHPHLPPGLIEKCLDVLRKVVPSERELIRIVVEIIVELRDSDDPIADTEDDHDGARSDTSQSTTRKEKSLRRTKDVQSMTPEEKHQADLTDLRCLTLCIGMLERVDESFEDNSTLEGILGDLIVPAVKRKESVLREKGLISLGLCCLIAKSMAINSFQLFLSQVQSAHEELKLKVLKIIFDLLVMYDREFLGRSAEVSQQIVTFVLQMLETEESSQVQSVLCVGICKLLLSGQVTDTRVLASLILTYVSPATADNAELRQCLSYFFPLYCYSALENQRRMQSIFISAFDLASRVHEELEEDQEMISLHQFGLLFVDWTDPTKLLNAPPKDANDQNVHPDLAISILLALYDSDRTDDNRKVFCQLLGQLNFIGSTLNPRTVLKLHILLDKLQDQCPLDNAALDRIFNRFKDKFSKAYSKQLEEIDPRQYTDIDFQEFYDSIGASAPEPLPSEDQRTQDVPPSTPVLKERELNIPGDTPASAKPSSTGTGLNDQQPESPHDEQDQPISSNSNSAPMTPMKRATKRMSRPSPTKQAPVSPVRKKRGQTAKVTTKTKRQLAPKKQATTKAPSRRSTRSTRSQKIQEKDPSESEGTERSGRP